MNKKLVFSLTLLSAFYQINADELRLGININDGASNSNEHLSKCFTFSPADPTWGNDKYRYNFEDCTKIRKINDPVNIQCVQDSSLDIATNPSLFHHTSILTNKSKIRLDLLKQCGANYDYAKIYSFCKYNKNYLGSGVNNDKSYGTCSYFVGDKHERVIKNLLANASDNCKKVLQEELNDIKAYLENNKVRTITEYNLYQNRKLNDVVNFRTTNKFSFSPQPEFRMKPNQGEPYVMQDIFKEFKSDTTGRIEVSTTAYANSRLLIYMTENLPMDGDGDWKIKNFADLVVGNINVKDYCHGIGEGNNRAHLQNFTEQDGSGKLVDQAGNRLLYLDESNYNNAQGACNIYNWYYDAYTNGKVTPKVLEYLLLKNSRITYINDDEYFNGTKSFKEGGNLGGPTKCYNYDVESKTYMHSRINYFDYYKQRPYYTTEAGTSSVTNNFSFSIHKTHGDRKGIYEQGKGNLVSINARPAFPSEQYFTNSSMSGAVNVTFYPDADALLITDSVNKGSKNLATQLRVSNLNDVYFHLTNQGDVIPKRISRGKEHKYYLTKFTLKKKLVAENGNKLDNTDFSTMVENVRLELVPKEGIDGLGLKFTEGKFQELVKVSQKELDEGKIFTFILEVNEIVDNDGEYDRPLFQKANFNKENGKCVGVAKAHADDIVDGCQLGQAEIRVGNVEMPKVTFGTAYNPKNPDSIIKNDRVVTGVQTVNSVYTRTNNQDIYLGFINPTNPYDEQFVKFFDKDGNPLNATVYNENQKLSEKNDKCDGYYSTRKPLTLKLNDKLPVGQNYEFKFIMAEYDEIGKECYQLGEGTTNKFSIRPESIEYKVNGKNTFDKKAGKVDDSYTNNDVVFTTDKKDDRFGVGIAELRVNDSKNTIKTLYLENENAEQLRTLVVKNTPIANFTTDGNVKIKTVFPMLTDAKIALAESKFTLSDFVLGICANDNKVLTKEDGIKDAKNNANKIDENGKINCQTPGNEISVNFTANENLNYANVEKVENEVGLKRDSLNILAFSDDNNDQLMFPIQLQNVVNNGSEDKYFYKKYSNDSAKVTYDFKYSNINATDFNKIKVNVESDLTLSNNDKLEFNVTGLNSGFDSKLSQLQPENKLSDYDENLFSAKNYGKVILGLRYPKTVNNKFNLLPKFVITKDSKAKVEIGSPVTYTKEKSLDKDYDVAFTTLKFKDISCKAGASCFKNTINTNKVQFVYFDEAKKERVIKTKDNPAAASSVVYDGYLRDLASQVKYVADYGTKVNVLDYDFDTKYKTQSYVKDNIKVIPNAGNSYLDSNNSFTIEVDIR
ncbi:hypothetical protein [Campylobacter sp. MG1]|uniref:hypothetical protein n=1 Tax=Campylobacter sp. MG1 TaxID=2976332 RepID=UPI00226CBDF2|nr:hypothetical protein [Campylobacter sp. MG1]